MGIIRKTVDKLTKSNVEAARVEWEAAKVAVQAAEASVPSPTGASPIEGHIAVCEHALAVARARRTLALAASTYSLALDRSEPDAVDFAALGATLRADLEAVAQASQALEQAQAQARFHLLSAQQAHEAMRQRREREGLPPGAGFPELTSATLSIAELLEQHAARNPTVPDALSQKVTALEAELQELQASAERRAQAEDRVREQEAEREARERANREARVAAPAVPWAESAIGKHAAQKTAEELVLARGWLSRQAARVGL
jgi:hypothetical protein